jgi:light-regulated signal transduction histidine kinase (bacteriophytochrome)
MELLHSDLQQRACELEAANKELETFSYSVSHDLRAPLRHIEGFVKLLDREAGASLETHSRHYLKVIAESARQMGVLIDNLLLFSRTGRAEMRCARLAANTLVREAIAALEPDIGTRRIEWTIHALPEVVADQSMLRQVWINLLSNAIKYTRPRDPARIEIGCTSSDSGENIFFVRDNGVGFDMEYAQRLFGVFQRLHRNDEFEGTGIGLANVHQIIRRHGGRAWAQSRVNEGATFFFSLPRAPAGDEIRRPV